MSILGGVPHDGKGPASVDFADWSQVGIILDNLRREDMAVKFNPDKVNPSHYVGHTGLECHAVQRAVLGQAGMGAYWHGCAIKYVFRALRKNGSEDIRKAIRCLQFWLDEVDPDAPDARGKNMRNGSASNAGGSDPG